jgi:hypothetical protein
MRTSVDLNDRLLTLAKQAATKRGISLRELFEQALRAYLEPTKRVEGYDFNWKVDQGDVLPGVPIHDWSTFRAWLDEQ